MKYVENINELERVKSEIIQAQPGYFTVYNYENKYEVGEPIIAWRVEVVEDSHYQQFSDCNALTVNGDVDNQCVGVINPNFTITLFDGSHFSSLKELQQEKCPK